MITPSSGSVVMNNSPRIEGERKRYAARVFRVCLFIPFLPRDARSRPPARRAGGREHSLVSDAYFALWSSKYFWSWGMIFAM